MGRGAVAAGLAVVLVLVGLSGCGSDSPTEDRGPVPRLEGAYPGPDQIAFWDVRSGLAVTSGYQCGSSLSLTEDGGRTWRNTHQVRNTIGTIVTAGESDVWMRLDRCLDTDPLTHGDLIAWKHSSDRGRTWEQLTGSFPWRVSFATPRIGLGFTDKTLLETRDGGRTWRRAPGQPCRWAHTTGDAHSLISYPAPDRAWAHCDSVPPYGPETVRLYASNDGGRSWRRVRPGRTGAQIPNTLHFSSSGFGFLDGYDEYRRSRDGGRHWGLYSQPIYGQWRQTLPVAAGSRVLYSLFFREGVELAKSTDAGDTWTAVHHWPVTGEDAEEIEEAREVLESFGRQSIGVIHDFGHRDRDRLRDHLREAVDGSDVRATGGRPPRVGPLYVRGDYVIHLAVATPSGHQVQLLVLPGKAGDRFVYFVDGRLDGIAPVQDP